MIMATDEVTTAHRVAMGVEYLDSRYPGWWTVEGGPVTSVINVDTLDVASDSACVLAQLSGDSYDEGRYQLGVTHYTAHDLGFVTLHRGTAQIHVAGTEELTDLWRSVITQRRAAVATLASATTQ